MALKDQAAKTAVTEQQLPKAQTREDNQEIVQDQLRVVKETRGPVRKARANVRTIAAVLAELQDLTAAVTLATAATVAVAKDKGKDKVANAEVVKVTQAATMEIAPTIVAVDVALTTIAAAEAISAITVAARTTETEISSSMYSVKKLITHRRKSSFVVI